MKNRSMPEPSHASQRAAAAHAGSAHDASALARQLKASPRLVAQRQSLDAMFGPTAQREPMEDELATAQPRFAAHAPGTAQLEGGLEDEMPATAQGRFAPGGPLQKKDEGADGGGPAPNRTGMPDGLKSGIESLSGMDMSDVRVHRNSSEPAQLNALAFAQGNDIHLGPGQDQHLPHEAWHVVQQRQGRVAPTMQMQGVSINDDAGLEHEADVMGSQALQTKA
jgi:hypothetical protein